MIREFLRHSLLELAKETLSSHSVRSVQREVSNGFGVWGYFVGEKMGQVFFLVWDHCQNRELAVLQSYFCWKASPLYSKSMLKSLKILKMTFVKTMKCVFHLSKGSSTLTEGFFKKTKLDVIRWRQSSAESPKMCRKSGLEFLQRKTLCIDLIVVYAVIHPCML